MLDLSDQSHFTRADTTLDTAALKIFAGGVAETEENPLRRTKQTRARANQFLHIIDFFGFSPLNSNKNEKCENEKNLSLASLYTQKRPHRCSESPF